MAKYDCFENYGVKLKRLTEDKIELVRRWRNDPKISQFMEFRDHITPEQQLEWFLRIDNENNYYFIIEANCKEIGCINIRDIDYEKGEGEGGIFIWDDDCPPLVSLRSVLALNDFGFFTLGLNTLLCRVLKDNKRAIRFNLSLGYEIYPDQEDVYNQKYFLTVERYKSSRNKIMRYL